MQKNLTSIFCVLTLSLVVSFAHPSAIQAQATESSPSGDLSLDTTEKLKARIEKIVEEKRTQVMGALSEMGRERRGFIGEVQRVSAETITIRTPKGTQILSIDPEVIITKDGKSIAVDTIAVGDWAMVIGIMESDTFTPQLIDISSDSLRPRTQKVMLGTITDINRTSIDIKHRTRDEENSLTLTKNSTYLDNNGETIEVSDLETELQVLVVAQEGSNGLELASLKLLSALPDSQ